MDVRVHRCQLSCFLSGLHSWLFSNLQVYFLVCFYFLSLFYCPLLSIGLACFTTVVCPAPSCVSPYLVWSSAFLFPPRRRFPVSSLTHLVPSFLVHVSSETSLDVTMSRHSFSLAYGDTHNTFVFILRTGLKWNRCCLPSQSSCPVPLEDLGVMRSIKVS